MLSLVFAGLGGLWLPPGSQAQPRWQHNPFGLGVASGSPTHDSVVLWTRLHLEGQGGGAVALIREQPDEKVIRLVKSWAANFDTRRARDKNRAAVLEALKGVTGGKSISLSERIDPSIIGGLIVKVGSKMVDASLKTKLNSMKLAMKEVG